MPDYESMYYELLLASQKAINILEDAVRDIPPCTYFASANPSASLHTLTCECRKASNILFSATQNSENIYTDTYYDNPECDLCIFDAPMILD